MTGLGQTRPRMRRDLSTALVVGCFVVAPGAAADPWYFEPKAALDAFYDTNVRLLSEGGTDSPGARARVQVKGGRRTETTDVALDAAVVAWRYFDASQYDSNDVSLDLTAVQKLERDRLALSGRVDFDSTATSELETSGKVQVNKRRQRLYLSPSWVHSLSERATIEARASYADVRYEDAGPRTGLADYTYLTALLAGTCLLSENTRASARLSFDRYDATTLPSTVDSVGVAVGLRHAFSETLSGWAEIGARLSESTYRDAGGDTGSLTRTGPVAEMGLDWRGETARAVASLRRALVPSGSGELLDTTRASLSAQQDLSPRWSVLASLGAYRNRDELGAPGTRDDRDYLAFEPSVRYRLTEWWEVRGSYRYRWQAYDAPDRSADSHAVFLSVAYTWPRESVAPWSELE